MHDECDDVRDLLFAAQQENWNLMQRSTINTIESKNDNNSSSISKYEGGAEESPSIDSVNLSSNIFFFFLSHDKKVGNKMVSTMVKANIDDLLSQ